ncbi:MAG: YceI family protein [Flavobacteriales bacterium]
MKKIMFLLCLSVVVSCSFDKASTGNSGAVSGNSDKKNYDAEETHHEEKEEQNTVTEPFRFDSTKVKLTFTAYKLPGEKRTGVNGTFKTINVAGAKESDKAEEVLSDTTFSIPTASLFTKDEDRDKKLIEFFFNKLVNTADITGSFGKFEGGQVPVTLKLNDKEVTKNFQYQILDRKLTLSGKIDIVEDFTASEALNSVNEACKDLHEGKTWSDVDLKAEIEL